MKHLLFLMTSVIVHCAAVTGSLAAGFTDSHVLFYGEVRQSGAAQTVLLQSGHLEMTFVNQSNPANRVSLETDLAPTGAGDIKPYSYSLKVPLAYLPEAPRMGEFLSIGSQSTSFKIQDIKINGISATLPDGSKEFYSLSFASRGSEYQLDLLISGDSKDTDGDGLPDWWELLYGLDPNFADANGDLDGDGWSNLEEFRRGANPVQSNRKPQMASTGISIPESGEGGVFLDLLDSDTANSGIDIALTGLQAAAFEIRCDGVALHPGEVRHVTYADVLSGRVTIRNVDRTLKQVALPIVWSDGTTGASTGQLMVKVASPSTQDGSDSSLWLDGKDLAADGSRVGVWQDRSGNSRSATQPLAANQPVSRSRAADFSAVSGSHLFFKDVAFPSGNHTVFASYQSASSSESSQTLLSTNRGFLQVSPTNQALSYPGAAIYQMDGLAVRGFENCAGLNTTSIFRRTGSVLENTYGISYDGQNIDSLAIDPVLPTIGARRTAIPGDGDPVDERFGGLLHELIVFPTALDEQKLRDVNDYLDSKWGGSVIWDLSTEVKAIRLSTASGTGPQIIRGGHGDDQLTGGPSNDVLSGGGGADTLTGGAGVDRFVFGGLDTGKDAITDFNPDQDVLDLSALFWGKTGDARLYVSVRLDADFSTDVPTIDSALLVKRPDGTTQEIVLKNKAIGSSQLIQMIVEGHLRMGGLSIPAQVQIALGSGSSSTPISESIDQSFTIVATRSGAGTAAALEVPVGFFEDALGGQFVIDGATSNAGRRSVVTFARGQTSKTLTVRPIPDLKTSGVKTVQVAALPSHKYAVGGSAITKTVSDQPMVWLEAVESNAVSSTGQPASLLVRRDGDLSQSLTVYLQYGGTAKQGVHVQQLPQFVVVPAGMDSAEVSVNALSEGLVRGPKVLLFQLVSKESYLLGNPNELLVNVATTAVEAANAGFDRWLQTSTNGRLKSLADLSGMSQEEVSKHLQAYAFGLKSADENATHKTSFRINNGRPEILTHGRLNAADVRWTVESTSSLDHWTDQSGKFAEADDPTGVKLVGEPLQPQATSGFYRLGVNLDPGQLATGSITSLTGSDRFGIRGNATWKADQASGDIVSSGGNAGETSRIIAEVAGNTTLDFVMKVANGGSSDLLVFYVDGVKQQQTNAASVTVQRQLSGQSTHLLMWEFKRGTGNAVIGHRK